MCVWRVEAPRTHLVLRASISAGLAACHLSDDCDAIWLVVSYYISFALVYYKTHPPHYTVISYILSILFLHI